VTIAACYVSAEGVVFGADSTSTMQVMDPGRKEGKEHYFNFGQKVFEIGEKSTLAVTTWGLGSLGSTSYRTLIALLADSLIASPAKSVEEVAWRWNQLYWDSYYRFFAGFFERARFLAGKQDRTEDEELELVKLHETWFAGFCLGGYVLPNRSPEAYQMTFRVTMPLAEPPVRLSMGAAKFWGWSNLIERVLWGVDDNVFSAVLKTGKWNGTPEELAQALLSQQLGQPIDLPLREAIDWVHASIYTTIKAMKFSHWAPYCGGPIEVAVVSTDRRFRWVRHKDFSAALC